MPRLNPYHYVAYNRYPTTKSLLASVQRSASDGGAVGGSGSDDTPTDLLVHLQRLECTVTTTSFIAGVSYHDKLFERPAGDENDGYADEVCATQLVQYCLHR